MQVDNAAFGSLEQRVMDLEFKVEQLQLELKKAKGHNPDAKDFSLSIFVEGKLRQKTLHSTVIEMEKRIDERLELQVDKAMSVDDLYQRLERRAMDIIFEKYIKPAEADIDKDSKIKRLESAPASVKIQTVNKKWYLEKMEVKFHFFGNALPRSKDSLSKLGISEKTILRLDVVARLTMDWDVVKERRWSRTMSQTLDQVPPRNGKGRKRLSVILHRKSIT